MTYVFFFLGSVGVLLSIALMWLGALGPGLVTLGSTLIGWLFLNRRFPLVRIAELLFSVTCGLILPMVPLTFTLLAGIDRAMTYDAARTQSRQFAPAVAVALREGELDEPIKISDRYKKSHLAKDAVAGLKE